MHQISLEQFRASPLQSITDAYAHHGPIVEFSGRRCHLLEPADAIKCLSEHEQDVGRVFGYQQARRLLGEGLFASSIEWPKNSELRNFSQLAEGIVSSVFTNGVIEDVHSKIQDTITRILLATFCSGILTHSPDLHRQIEDVVSYLDAIALTFANVMEAAEAQIPLVAWNKIEENLRRTLGDDSLAKLKRAKALTGIVAGYLQMSLLLEMALLHAAWEQDWQHELRNSGSAAHKILLRTHLDEVLRLYPPVWLLARQAQIDFQINELTIHAGEFIFASPFVYGRSASSFREPNIFMSKRWQPEQGPANREGHLPFGRGPRACPGEAFVRRTISSVLDTVLQKYRVSAPDQGRLKLTAGVTLQAAGSSTLILESA